LEVITFISDLFTYNCIIKYNNIIYVTYLIAKTNNKINYTGVTSFKSKNKIYIIIYYLMLLYVILCYSMLFYVILCYFMFII